MKLAFGSTTTFQSCSIHQHEEMIEWCRQHIGIGTWWAGFPALPDGMAWCISLNINDRIAGRTTFWFKNEQDFIFFVLRWS